jgi:hypothetical protein
MENLQKKIFSCYECGKLFKQKDYPAIKGRLMGTANGNVTNAMYHLLAPS